MNVLKVAAISLIIYCLQIVVAPALAVWGIKPIFPVMALAYFALNDDKHNPFAYAFALGLLMDSENILGLHIASYITTVLIGTFVISFMYDKSIYTLYFIMLLFGIIEGGITLTLYQTLYSETEWWAMFVNSVLLQTVLGLLIMAGIHLLYVTKPLLFKGRRSRIKK